MSAWAGSGDAVPGADVAVSEDVGAQPAAVHQRTQDRARGVAVDHRARPAQTRATAAHGADSELAGDEAVQVDCSRDDVSAVLVRVERRFEGLADLRLDQRQRASGEA